MEPWLTMMLAPGLGTMTAHKLLESFGTADNIINASGSKLEPFGLSKKAISSLINPDTEALHRNIRWAADENHHIITFSDDRYPTQLKNIVDAPLVLFVRGDPDYLNQPQLAMVRKGRHS